MQRKILIANRGEIAVRIIRTAREMGIGTVAVYSEADKDSVHAQMADEAHLLGPASPSLSYLNIEKILEVAEKTGATAIHPGYGFLAENAGFARAILAKNVTWIGPHPDAIDAMGDKLRARRAMQKANVPFVPGGTEPIESVEAAHSAAEKYGLPLALKASGGGGGKGLKVARTFDELEAAFSTAKREAAAYFKNDIVYAERYLDNPKHVELQILADKHGTVLHVGERDCSLQRRHQKLWEEAPARISEKVRAGMREAGIRAAQAIGYDSVGTIECLVAGDEFFFLEMNTRIQVEHTVSEMISGLDLIREQINVAFGEPLAYAQHDIAFRGHAIEGRVNAEDPSQNFRPAPGKITAYREPAGLGIRVDSAAYPGYDITPDYDSMIAKLIVWAPTREEAIARLRRAIDEYTIAGVPTTLPLLRALCDYAPVHDASYGTATLENFTATQFDGASYKIPLLELVTKSVAQPVLRRLPPRLSRKTSSGGNAATGDSVLSPMHGVVIELKVQVGEEVTEGQVIAVIEAMKMMNEIRAHKSGTAKTIHTALGATVESQSPILTLGDGQT